MTLSSPVTYRVRRSAQCSGICSDSVDLPMPGSPPISTSDPGTMPPPRILSTSPLCSEMRDSPEAEMSRSCTGRRRSPAGAAAGAPGFRLSRGCSTIVFHSPQAGQRPIHLGLSLPHEVQNQTVLTLFAIISSPLPVK